MREAFVRFIRKHALTEPGDTVLIALSGGADSMALLHLFAECADELSVRLAVAHVDHGLRPESPSDAAFARDAARRLGLPFALRTVDVSARLGPRGGGVESAARDLRYAALMDCARECAASRIATAHHLDDQFETLLMRLLRGSGAGGLRGIAPKRADGVIRPLLFATRAQILAYLEARGIPYVTDASNLDPTYTRNRLRLEVIPSLISMFPGAREAAARGAEIQAAEDAYLEDAAQAWLEARLQPQCRLSLAGFPELHVALQRRALRLYVAGMATTHNLTYDHVESLRALALGRTGGRLSLPGLVLEKESAGLRRVSRPPLTGEAPLQVPGQTRLPGIALDLSPAAPPYAMGESPWVQYIDAEKLPQQAVLRGPRPGDRLHALGATGSKKLSEHMIDRKIPRDVRASLPVIAVGPTVLWAAGVALSQELAVTPQSKCVLRCALAWDILEPLFET